MPVSHSESLRVLGSYDRRSMQGNDTEEDVVAMLDKREFDGELIDGMTVYSSEKGEWIFSDYTMEKKDD